MKTMNLNGLAIAMCLLTTCNRPLITTTLEPNLFEQTLHQTPDPQLIDVRTPKEYEEEHLPNAINIDIKAATFDSLILQLDNTKPVFVYCRSGKRSLESANVFEKNKFKVVYNLDGGIIAWKAKGKPVVVP